MENRFYNIIKDANSYRLLNRNEPTKSTITKYSEDAMEVVIDNIKLIIPVLGYTPFENRISKSEFISENEKIFNFYIKNTELHAECRFNLEKYLFNLANPRSNFMPFTLLKGSRISNKINSSLTKKLKQQRQECTDSNVIKDGILQKDLDFKSASYVAGFVLGRSSNGKIELKTNDGQTFKDWLAER